MCQQHNGSLRRHSSPNLTSRSLNDSFNFRGPKYGQSPSWENWACYSRRGMHRTSFVQNLLHLKDCCESEIVVSQLLGRSPIEASISLSLLRFGTNNYESNTQSGLCVLGFVVSRAMELSIGKGSTHGFGYICPWKLESKRSGGNWQIRTKLNVRRSAYWVGVSDKGFCDVGACLV